MKLRIISFAFVIVIIVLAYFLYTCHFGATSGQRVFPTPTTLEHQLMLVFVADAVMDADKLFLTKKLSGGDFISMFNTQELETVKENSTKFFKEYFGLSDAYLNLAMSELRVNPKGNYRTPDGNSVVDGGFVVPVPKGMKLYGLYGGKNGVASDRAGVLAYGHYKIQDGYNIIYKSTCPLVSFSTFDGNYNPIDCYVEIIQSPNPREIGMKGKAIGVYKNTKVNNELNHIVIRNVLTF